MLDLEEIARSSLYISLDDYPVPCSEIRCSDKVVGMRLVGSSARAWIRLDSRLLWLSVVDESECLPLEWEEGEPVLQDEHKMLLLFF